MPSTGEIISNKQWATIFNKFFGFKVEAKEPKEYMENIGIVISILVGLVTLLSMLVWFGRFIQRVNVHDKKLDEVSSDMYLEEHPNIIR